jgi:hypothetical protein
LPPPNRLDISSLVQKIAKKKITSIWLDLIAFFRFPLVIRLAAGREFVAAKRKTNETKSYAVASKRSDVEFKFLAIKKISLAV